MSALTFLEKQEAKKAAARRQRVNSAKPADSNDVRQIVVQKQTANGVVPGVVKNTVSVAKNIVAAAISSGMKIDIDLETQILGQLMDNTLKITVNNTTDADITCPKLSQEMITSIKILCNDGNTQICELTKETLMYPMRFLDQSTLARIKRGYESDEDEVIASGASRTWYIPLIADPFAINEVFMQAVQGRLVYKVEFDKGAWVDGHPVLTELSMYSRHLYYDMAVMEARKNADMQMIRNYNFRSYVAKNPSKIITAGANLEVNLDGFANKRASELILQLWKNGQHLVDFGQYIDSYDITDAGNTSLIASGPIDSVYDDVVLSAVHDYEPVIGTTRDSWTVISFSPSMAADFNSGESHGQRLFTGKEILKLKISASLPDSSYQLRIYYGELNKMKSAGGVFSLTE